MTGYSLEYRVSILLITQDMPYVEELMGILRLLDQDIVLAESFDEGLKILALQRTPVVFFRWTLGSEDCQNFCNKAREVAGKSMLYMIATDHTNCVGCSVEALNASVDDFIYKPLDPVIITLRTRAATEIIRAHNKSGQIDNAYQELESAYSEVTSDLRLAGRVQRDLLPQPLQVEDITATGFYRPASFIAGDAYDYFMLNRQYLAFYIVDVVGHGTAAAMVSFAIHNQLNPKSHGICRRNLDACLSDDKSVDEAVIATVNDLNTMFYDDSDRCQYFTMIYGLVDIDTGLVTFSQAGHPAVVHLHTDSGTLEEIGTGGFPVGMFEQPEYNVYHCHLQPGDRLVLYSDGATDNLSPTGVEFGHERLLRALKATHRKPLQDAVNSLENELLEWHQQTTFDDDVSTVFLQYGNERRKQR